MAVHCIRDGGTGDGSAWNNALDDLPSNFTRGDYYYIADGSYGGHSFSTALAGTTPIYIRKATVADHGGIETGWSDTYGDGQASFTGAFDFQTGYWTFDGATRNVNNWKDNTAYGFSIIMSSPTKIFNRANNANNVTIQYCYLQNVLSGDISECLFYLMSVSNWNINHCYGLNCGKWVAGIGGGGSHTFEYNYFARNRSTTATHGEGIQSEAANNCIIRYNVWEDMEGTGYLMIGAAGDNGVVSGWKVYGNVFLRTSGFPNAGQNGGAISDGVVGTWAGGTNNNQPHDMLVYNNTFIYIDPTMNVINWDTVDPQGNMAYNNLFYGCGTGLFTGVNIHDYNAFDGTNAQGETNAQIGITSAIFEDYANRDLHITENTDAGYNLGVDYDEDMDGVARINWDRGAYEYVSGATPEPITVLAQSTVSKAHK